MAASSDPVIRLMAEVSKLEGASDFWAAILQIATAVVIFGVAIEVVATIIEAFEDRKHGKPLPWHVYLTLVGGALVAAAVGFELVAEYKTASLETAIRADNGLVQAIDSDRNATDVADISLTIAQYGSLDKYVRENTRRINADIAALNDAEKRAKAALTQIDVLKQQENDLRSEISKSEASFKETERLAGAAYKRSSPRRMLSCNTWEPLRAQPQRPIEVLYSESAPDAFLFAIEIGLCLHDVGWKSEYPKPIPKTTNRFAREFAVEESVELAGGSPGGASITVAVNSKGRTMTTFVEGTPEAAVAKALSDVFGDAVATNVRENIPEGTIRIVIGPK